MADFVASLQNRPHTNHSASCGHKQQQGKNNSIRYVTEARQQVSIFPGVAWACTAVFPAFENRAFANIFGSFHQHRNRFISCCWKSWVFLVSFFCQLQKQQEMTMITQTHIKPTTTLMTVNQAADYLGLAVSTLNKWRCHGGGPVFIKMGRAVRYRAEDLNLFLTECATDSTITYSDIWDRTELNGTRHAVTACFAST